MRLFGPSKDEVWFELSRQIGADYEMGGMWRGSKVRASVGPWVVTLDTYTVSTGETSQVYTRMRAPYVNRDGFRFTLRRTSMFTGIGKFFGMQDIEIGDPLFDEAFVIQANDPSRAHALLANERLRHLLLFQNHIGFSVKDDEGMFGPKFDEHVDELYFETGTVIKDLDRLKALFELFAETLHQLCHIGSAYEFDPNLPITFPETDTLLRGASAPPDTGLLLRPAAGSPEIAAADLPRASQKPDANG